MVDNRPWPLVTADEISWIDTEQMIEVDRIMIDDLRIELIQMMENAGRNLARLAASLHAPREVVVYAGSGGNGGGGLVAARHLANMGVDVSVVLGRDRDRFTPIPAHQLDIAERMGIDVAVEPPLESAAVAIDALIGYSLSGTPDERAVTLIDAIARHPVAVSLDVPSGLDSTTGGTPGAVVGADATLTLALPKRGLRQATEVGRLFVGDISVPPAAYRRLGVTTGLPPFDRAPIVEIIEGD